MHTCTLLQAPPAPADTEVCHGVNTKDICPNIIVQFKSETPCVARQKSQATNQRPWLFSKHRGVCECTSLPCPEEAARHGHCQEMGMSVAVRMDKGGEPNEMNSPLSFTCKVNETLTRSHNETQSTCLLSQPPWPYGVNSIADDNGSIVDNQMLSPEYTFR